MLHHGVVSVFDGLNDEQRPGVSDAEHRRLNPPVTKAKYPYIFLPVVQEAVEEFLQHRVIRPSYGVSEHDEVYMFGSPLRDLENPTAMYPHLALLANGKIVVAPRLPAHQFREVSLLDAEFYFGRPNLDLAIVRYLNFQLDPTALGRNHEGRPIQPDYDLPTSDPRFRREQRQPLNRDGLARFLRNDETVFKDMTIHHQVNPHDLADALYEVRGEDKALVRPAGIFRSAQYVTQPWELVSPQYSYEDDPRMERVIREGLTLDRRGNLFGTKPSGSGRPELHFGGYLMSDILIRLWRSGLKRAT